MQLPEKYRKQSESIIKYWQSNPAIQADEPKWNDRRLSYQERALVNPQHKQLQPIQRNIYIPPNRQSRGICTAVLIGLLMIILAFLLIDLKHQFQEQTIKNDKKKQICYQQYLENHCDVPLDALVQKCKNWGECANTDSKKAVRLSEKFAKVLGTFIRALCEHLSALGMLLIIAFILIYMHYSTKKVEFVQKMK